MPADLRLPDPDEGRDLLPGAIERDPELIQGAAGEPVRLGRESEQDVLGADVVVLQPPGFFLSEDDDVAGPVSESLKHETYGLACRQPSQYHAINRDND